MTISAVDYFRTRKADRKKEPRYLAVINKDSCTSCNACATVCPVDCIFEVVSSVPSESYHQIDTARCIGCQLCYRVPQESTDRYTLEICPWNAIDMLHNPNVKPDESVLAAYYKGSKLADELPWWKLEEYGYQFFVDGEVFLPAGEEELQAYLKYFETPDWFYDEGVQIPLVEEYERTDGFVRYRATPRGRDVFDVVFDKYEKMFLD